ncbi:hypothetical protein N9L47_10430 [Rhodobacteraceae bacterium]|nr:hypothetical protein [Paracoccaceae bacterium]
MLVITFTSLFRVTDDIGRDVTPRSAKARGLLAILALTRDMRRSRSWLRGKLWSASGPAQGSDSLRQALTEIRRALGPEADALFTDRRLVALDPDKVTINVPAAGTPEARDICGDIEVTDPEFQSWLDGVRHQQAGGGAVAASPPQMKRGSTATVVFTLAHNVPNDVQWVYQALREDISRLLRESGEIDIITEHGPLPASIDGRAQLNFIVMDVNAVSGQAVVSIRLECGATGKTMWNSGQKWLANDPSDETIWELHQLSYWTHEQTAHCIAETFGEPSGGNNAYALAIRGRKRLFEFSLESIIDADRMFAASYQIEPRGAFLAWRHFLRNTAIFEHLTDDFLEPINQVDLIDQAMVDDPTNSLVLAVASQDAFLRGNDLELASALVSDAINKNEVNPLGLGFQSNIFILNGQFDKSIQAAARAQSLVSNQSYRGFWSMFSCMSHVANGDYETAAFHANMSHYLMPRMVAAQRFLYALNEALGRESQALTVSRKIRKREPNFSKKDLFRSDYPVGTMRRTGIMELLS